MGKLCADFGVIPRRRHVRTGRPLSRQFCGDPTEWMLGSIDQNAPAIRGQVQIYVGRHSFAADGDTFSA